MTKYYSPGTPDGICRNNTTVSRTNGVLHVTLHETRIVEEMPNGNIYLDTGGWNTVTTRSRMNQALRALQAGFRVKSVRGVIHTYALADGASFPFFRTMGLTRDGQIIEGSMS